ncbi:hypothetical protein BGZ95_000675 [Linnemannia exigua]|uniref:FAD-binding domain-containing protein n=1 Tax=Linnemannia exigua TaxID=604196 RepID=A0AAD4H3A6_9FUNG|nr:hypothetical protein BGZ95_000675 [Linnemannia exigua]
MSTPTEKPTVIIVGAGLGGLMLGALLEKSGVPYTIFERATTVKPLGSAMSIGPTLLPIFQQIGVYDDILSIGKYLTHTETFKENLEPYKPQDYRAIEEYTGYGHYIVARPKYYDVILKQVPAHKIHFGKRVIDITEKDNKVTVHLSSNETFEGDIVVGADGAYSFVRQNIYEKLLAKGNLPKSDQEDLPFNCICLVGQTKPLDDKEFPCIKNPVSQFRIVLADDKPYSWVTLTTNQNTLCFMVMNHLPRTSTKAEIDKNQDTENSGWGPEAAQAMIDETRNFQIELSDGKKHTLGELYDLTPKELISKVSIEEKVFTTWHSGRVVLMGDGAVTAMHDAIALANLIYAMPTKTQEDITTIFEEYHKERLPAVMESFENSQIMSKLTDRGIAGTLYRLLITRMPLWLWRLALTKTVHFRPQVGFLKAIPLQGNVVPFVSPSEQKARAAYERQQEAAAANAASI